MGEVKAFVNEKLIAGIIINPGKADFFNVRDKLCSLFGEPDIEAGPFNFNHTDYYKEEMGESLVKYFLCFKKPVEPQQISQIKIQTNNIELSMFSSEGKRHVNIDPGLLNASRLVLVTTKNYAHRIPLQDGIYAEITLVYHKKIWEFLDWTYPDFRTAEYLSFLTQARTLYLAQIKEQQNGLKAFIPRLKFKFTDAKII